MADQQKKKPPSVSILIDGKQVVGWSDLEITDSIDAFSTVGFTAPFEAERREFRELFRPFSYAPVRVFVGDEPLFTGTLLGVKPMVEPDKRSVEVTAIALPGVLEDCTAPASALPLEFRKLSLADIARRLLEPFAIDIDFPDGSGSSFDKVKIDEDKKLVEFLITLAKQRSRLLSNTAEGQLLCWQPVAPGNPIARLKQYEPPVGKVEAEFYPQEYFSEITGYSGAKRGRKGSKYTALNPFLRDVLRPTAFKLDNTEKGDAPDEAKSRLGRMLANVAAYTIDDIPTWWTADGKLYTSNTTALVTAPDAMIYREYELLIRRVRRKQDADKWTLGLDLVLPGSFSGEAPQTLPWDD
jgi:prophage tail gpP-like protein